MEAVTEEVVVSPVGSPGSGAFHSYEVNESHDDRKDRKSEPTVRNYLVYLVGRGKAAGVFLLIASPYNIGDVDIALVRDDRFGVVIKFLFGSSDVRLDVRLCLFGYIQLLEDLFIALQDLYRIPALLFLGHIVQKSFFDMSNAVLNRSAECMLRNGLFVFCGRYSSLRSFFDSRTLQSGYLNYFAAELL